MGFKASFKGADLKKGDSLGKNGVTFDSVINGTRISVKLPNGDVKHVDAKTYGVKIR